MMTYVLYKTDIQYTTIFKGHPLRDSTQRFLKNKGHCTLLSTEPGRNKGQLQCLRCASKKFISAKLGKKFRGASRHFCWYFYYYIQPFLTNFHSCPTIKNVPTNLKIRGSLRDASTENF